MVTYYMPVQITIEELVFLFLDRFVIPPPLAQRKLTRAKMHRATLGAEPRWRVRPVKSTSCEFFLEFQKGKVECSWSAERGRCWGPERAGGAGLGSKAGAGVFSKGTWGGGYAPIPSRAFLSERSVGVPVLGKKRLLAQAIKQAAE